MAPAEKGTSSRRRQSPGRRRTDFHGPGYWTMYSLTILTFVALLGTAVITAGVLLDTIAGGPVLARDIDR